MMREHQAAVRLDAWDPLVSNWKARHMLANEAPPRDHLLPPNFLQPSFYSACCKTRYKRATFLYLPFTNTSKQHQKFFATIYLESFKAPEFRYATDFS